MIEPDEDDDPFLAALCAGEEARRERRQSLALGCGVPLILIPILILLAVINPH